MGERLDVLDERRRAVRALLADRGRWWRGRAACPETYWVRAEDWPDRKRFGTRTVRTRSGSRRSASAASRAWRGPRPRDTPPRADQLGHQLQPVQDEMGRQSQQGLVLRARGLALRAVGDDDRGATGAAARLGDRDQLAVRGEGGAAAAREPGLGERAQQLGRVAVRHRAVALLVGAEAGRGAAGASRRGGM